MADEAEVSVVDRLTLISQVARRVSAPMFLNEPFWIKPGQRFWYDDEASALVVEDVDGRTTSHGCHRETGPDAVR